MVQAQVLRLLHQHKSLSTGDVAAELGISAPAVTQLTDRLIRKHLIERRSAPGDRRSVLIALSSRGKRSMEHFRDRRGEILKSAMENLSVPDRQMALETMVKITAAIDSGPLKTALSAKEASKLFESKRVADRGK
jgi:DNA-binding MarR family transcriptional regulator